MVSSIPEYMGVSHLETPTDMAHPEGLELPAYWFKSADNLKLTQYKTLVSTSDKRSDIITKDQVQEDNKDSVNDLS